MEFASFDCNKGPFIFSQVGLPNCVALKEVDKWGGVTKTFL